MTTSQYSSAEEAERALSDWATVKRNEIVRAANAAGVTINRIHVITGIARSTIYRILGLQ